MTHHPEELVNVISGVSDDSPEDDKDIVHPQLCHDVIGRSLVAGHGLAHQGYVTVVPRVIIH